MNITGGKEQHSDGKLDIHSNQSFECGLEHIKFPPELGPQKCHYRLASECDVAIVVLGLESENFLPPFGGQFGF